MVMGKINDYRSGIYSEHISRGYLKRATRDNRHHNLKKIAAMNAIMLQGLLVPDVCTECLGSFAIISMGLQNLYAIKLIITIAMISSAVARRIFLLIDTSLSDILRHSQF